jgi:hypothetical protein
MSGGPATGVVVDTMAISWLLNDRPEDLAGRYRDLIGANPVLLAFQTLMELRYGAPRAGWGELQSPPVGTLGTGGLRAVVTR